MPFITSTPAPIRLAILETEEPIPSIQAKCGRLDLTEEGKLMFGAESLVSRYPLEI